MEEVSLFVIIPQRLANKPTYHNCYSNSDDSCIPGRRWNPSPPGHLNGIPLHTRHIL